MAYNFGIRFGGYGSMVLLPFFNRLVVEEVMLVLSRKVGERIVIAGDIEIDVVRILGNKVVLGVIAPSQVSVHRLEVHERIVADVQYNINKPVRGRQADRK